MPVLNVFAYLIKFYRVQKHIHLIRNYIYEVRNFLAVVIIALISNDCSLLEGRFDTVMSPSLDSVSILTESITMDYY